MPTLADLDLARPDIRAHRERKRALKQAVPKVRFWINPADGETAEGMLYLGQVDLRDCDEYEFPWKNNEAAQASVNVRATHYICEKIAKIPNDPASCKNVIITVDLYGGTLRWSGLMRDWTLQTVEGKGDYLTLAFVDDLQFLDFMLVPPNPALPIPIFQFPRVHFLFGPTRWCVATLILEQIIRLEGHPWTVPDDPFDLEQWFDFFNWEGWQVHVKGVSFLTDDSLWTLLASRMDTVKTTIADALDDAQLTILYRRILTVDGERPDGLLVNDVKNGALVFEIVDRSGWTLPEGTFFEGTAVAGFFRSVLQWGSGFVEDTLQMVNSSDALYPDEYYQSSWMATMAAAPGIILRDSHSNSLKGQVSHSPPTAVSVIVGGQNPTADAIAKLIIESVGNLLGYFLLAGFDSLGDMAADVIMPFLTGTILAWDEFKNTPRADSLGWIHLHEIFQSGGDNNSWSMAALAALRGGFKATGTQTSHIMEIGDNIWVIPGLHFGIGDRIGSTSGALGRIGIDMVFINRVEEMTLKGSGIERSFTVQCGKNKTAISMGERFANLLRKSLDQIQNVGLHLIS